MVGNKGKTSLIRHTQKRYVSLMKVNNIIVIRESFPIVVIATFHADTVTQVIYIFIGFDHILTEYPKNFKERRTVI